MTNSTRRITTYAVYIFGCLIGLYHLRIATLAIFLFRNNEPAVSWLSIIAGPLSTLPIVLLSFVKKQLAGYWLIVSAFISLTAFLNINDGVDLAKLALNILLPMLALGIAFVILSRVQSREDG